MLNPVVGTGFIFKPQDRNYNEHANLKTTNFKCIHITQCI